MGLGSLTRGIFGAHIMATVLLHLQLIESGDSEPLGTEAETPKAGRFSTSGSVGAP